MIIDKSLFTPCKDVMQKEEILQKPIKRRAEKSPALSVIILSIIVLGCLCSELFIPKDPTYLDLANYNMAPNCEFVFGTDSLGRDIFSMIWYGGRISLLIGFFSTLISSVIAIVVGYISAVAPKRVDAVIMRFTEIVMSVPSLLIIILIQAAIGKANVFTISIVIGIASWMSIAKIVRTEARQLRNLDYIIAAKSMGAGRICILFRHILPNLIPSIMFMIVMNIRGAIIAESTLSFMGIGLPIEIISWGSMLSLAEKALLTKSWWVILIPGIFLVVTLMCVTNIGNYLQNSANTKQRNL